jgi:hypothetical protein
MSKLLEDDQGLCKVKLQARLPYENSREIKTFYTCLLGPSRKSNRQPC